MKTTDMTAEYVGEHYNYSSYVRLTIESLELPRFDAPDPDPVKDVYGTVSKLSEFI